MGPHSLDCALIGKRLGTLLILITTRAPRVAEILSVGVLALFVPLRLGWAGLDFLQQNGRSPGMVKGGLKGAGHLDLALPPFWMLIQPFGDGARGGRDDRDWLLPTPASPVLSEEGSVSAPEGGNR
jgi:hypothetical protein